MRAGRMDRRIEIQGKTITPDAHGEETEGWATIATVWAEKRENGGSERFTAQQLIGSQVVTFRFRWSNAVKVITSEHRILFDGRIYEIEGGPREIGRREGIEVDCSVRTETQVDNG